MSWSIPGLTGEVTVNRYHLLSLLMKVSQNSADLPVREDSSNIRNLRALVYDHRKLYYPSQTYERTTILAFNAGSSVALYDSLFAVILYHFRWVAYFEG